MADLFGSAAATADTGPRPLADRLRPQALDQVIGQEQVPIWPTAMAVRCST